MRRFWIALYAVTALGHVTFALALRHALAAALVPAPTWIALAAAAILAALLRGRVRRGIWDRHLPGWRRVLIEEPYYVHWCAALLSSLLFVPLLPPFLVASWIGAVPGVAGAGALAAACYIAALLLAVYGVLIRRRWLRVRELDVSIPGLAPAFDGYRIAHLSDLHIGSLCPRARADAWVDRANALDADLCALTGDYVTSGVAFHDDIAAALTRLRARDGVVAVMGNHDYFGDGEPLITLLREGGVQVLRNERTVVSRGADRLIVAGVDDIRSRRADVGRALSGRDPGVPTVVLAHDPRLFPEIAERGAALVLSGHTHWGQVTLPFLPEWNISRTKYRFHTGAYATPMATLYVHPGMGTTGPPIRIGAPPEITVLRLRAGRQDADTR